VLPDNPLQPPCPLAISLVVNWEEDFITLGVFELSRDKFPRKTEVSRGHRLRFISEKLWRFHRFRIGKRVACMKSEIMIGSN
jgi:hypothetical protein